jgi:putative ABC transport system permease protein
MTRHLIRLMWNRKRQNLLLMIEIFVAFLVVVAVGVIAMHFGNNARQPLGFSIDRVWSIDVNRGRDRQEDPATTAPDRDTFRQIFAELGTMPAIEAAAGAFTGPYRWYSWNERLRVEGRPERMVSANRVDDRFQEVLGLQLAAGRWFSRQDDGVSWEPVVVNRYFAREVFGPANPIGRVIQELPPLDEPGPLASNTRPKRVVGVVDDFRQFGELSTPSAVMFYRITLDAPPDRLQLPENILIRVAPGTTASFEETLVRRLGSIAPGWSIGVQPVDALREDMLRQSLVPLAIVAVVAGALLLMVALGLTGVVWQNVTQRMREFGVRRAHGATAAGVGRQVIAELVVMTSFAVAAGLVVIAQIPLLPFPRDLTLVPRPVFMMGVAAAVAAIYVVTVLCAWYPSRLATRVPPAEALHYE